MKRPVLYVGCFGFVVVPLLAILALSRPGAPSSAQSLSAPKSDPKVPQYLIFSDGFGASITKPDGELVMPIPAHNRFITAIAKADSLVIGSVDAYIGAKHDLEYYFIFDTNSGQSRVFARIEGLQSEWRSRGYAELPPFEDARFVTDDWLP